MEFHRTHWTTPPRNGAASARTTVPAPSRVTSTRSWSSRRVDFLRGDMVSVEPRKLWAPGAVLGLGGKIDPGNGSWRGPSVYGDAGGRPAVLAGKYEAPRVPAPTSFKASVAAIVSHGSRPGPGVGDSAPVRNPQGARRGLARALADALGLPFADCLTVRVDGLRRRRCSTRAAAPERAPQLGHPSRTLSEPGPVLLVDDHVDSGWTMTVAAGCSGRTDPGRCTRTRSPLASGRQA